MLVVTPQIRIPQKEFEITLSRSAGPGGQNVNKVNSKATLRWAVLHSPSLPEAVCRRLVARYRRRVTSEGDLLVTSQRYRDAPRNVADCLEKLRKMIAEVALPPRFRRPTRPTRGSVERRLRGKSHQSAAKRGRRTEPEGD
jgi:ribosome-associated protein